MDDDDDPNERLERMAPFDRGAGVFADAVVAEMLASQVRAGQMTAETATAIINRAERRLRGSRQELDYWLAIAAGNMRDVISKAHD